MMFTHLILPTALAAGAAGSSTPALGGGLASPGADGAAGLFHTPASAHPDSGELLLNLQYVYSRVEMQLEGQDQEVSQGGDLIPALAVAGPIGPVGLGLALMAPYGRGGDNGEDSSLRFHNQSGEVRVLEADLCLAAAPARWLTVGGAARVGAIALETVNAVDTGVLIAGAVDGGEEALGDPFLEGTQSVLSGSGTAWGWAAGLRAEPAPGWAIAASYRSRLQGMVRADLSYYPSDALAVEITGEVLTWMELPDELSVAGQIPLGEATVTPELTWVGWSSWARLDTRLQGLRFSSRDPVLDGVLEGFGTTLEALLADMEASVTANGNRDILSGGVSVRGPLAPGWDLLGGAWYVPASVPDEYVNPGNVDFDTLDLRFGAAWSSRRRTRLTGLVDLYLAGERSVSGTLYDPLADGASGLALPSGDGRYALELYRFGLSLEQGFGPGGRRPEPTQGTLAGGPYELLD